MKITDKRTARVWLSNASSAVVSFLAIPPSAFVDNDGSHTLAADRAEKITVPVGSHAVIDIPAGYRIGVEENQSRNFSCSTFGSNPLKIVSIGDYTEPGDILYDVAATCAQQGDIISASVADLE